MELALPTKSAEKNAVLANKQRLQLKGEGSNL